jgi:hypothetical protein
VPYSLLDATQEANRDLRNALFGISGKRAVYPQIFLKAPGGSGTFTFVGLYEEVQELADDDARSGGFTARFAPALVGGAGGGAQHVDASSLGVAAGQAISSGGVAAAPPPPAAAATAAVTAPTAAAAATGTVALASSPTAGPSPPAAAAPAAAPSSSSSSSAASSGSWQRHVDRRSGDSYWWNPVTRESSWVDPTAPSVLPVADGVWSEQWDAKRQRKYYYNRRTGASTWALPREGAA